MVIRLEFLVDDLKKDIKGDNVINPLIVKAWRECLNFLKDNGIECTYTLEDDIEIDLGNIYSIEDKNDLIDAIKNGVNAWDIHDVVNDTTQGKSSYFMKNAGGYTYTFTTEDLRQMILKNVENIAYNILYYPYKPIFGELYKLYVVPMIDGQN